MHWVLRYRLQLYLGLLSLLFLPFLIRLVGLALDVDLHSHVLLIPFISGYLVWQRQREQSGERRAESGEGLEPRNTRNTRKEEVGGQRSEVRESDRKEERGESQRSDPDLVEVSGSRPSTNASSQTRTSPSYGLPVSGSKSFPSPRFTLLSPPQAVVLFVMGLVLTLVAVLAGSRMTVVDALALQTAGFLCLAVAGAGWFLGPQVLGRHAFALAFLVFMIPMPTIVENGLEIFFQNTSAEATYWMFQTTGTTVLRTGRTFELPGLTIEVAQECSGIRSSYVLFIVSLLAGYMFLQRRFSRWVLTLFVIPLGIVRNGFRIVTISLLTIHWDPGVIHSPLHHRGGPLFFALSLVPFFAVLWGLRMWERRAESGERRPG